MKVVPNINIWLDFAIEPKIDVIKDFSVFLNLFHYLSKINLIVMAIIEK